MSSAPSRHGLRQWEPRSWPGTREAVSPARRWVADTVLVYEHAPTRVRDQVRLVVSELVTNTVCHTDSGQGGKFAVHVSTAPGWARVEIHDQGADTVPAPRTCPDPLAENGRGLFLVDALTHTWGTLDHGAAGVVFAEWTWGNL